MARNGLEVLGLAIMLISVFVRDIIPYGSIAVSPLLVGLAIFIAGGAMKSYEQCQICGLRIEPQKFTVHMAGAHGK
jgi:hypothetical protein